MSFVMRVVGMAGTYYENSGDPVLPDPCYIKDYDLDYLDGRGRASLTGNPAEARSWKTAVEVFDAWRTVSPRMPRRDDGQPNRPLTAYNITPEARV